MEAWQPAAVGAGWTLTTSARTRLTTRMTASRLAPARLAGGTTHLLDSKIGRGAAQALPIRRRHTPPFDGVREAEPGADPETPTAREWSRGRGRSRRRRLQSRGRNGASIEGCRVQPQRRPLGVPFQGRGRSAAGAGATPGLRGAAYPFAEKRRLLYVAMTRARNGAYLVADPVQPSTFVTELLKESDGLRQIGELAPECARCHRGRLRPLTEPNVPHLLRLKL